MPTYLGSLGQLVWGGLRLDGDTVRALQGAPDARLIGITAVLLAGASYALGHCVVLVINRVAPARLVALTLLLAGLSAAGALLWVGTIWLLASVLFGRATSADGLLIAGFAFIPLTLSVLTIIPYLGLALESLLGVWTLLGMVVAVVAAFGLDFLPALGCTVLGWAVIRIGPRVLAGRLVRRLEREWRSGSGEGASASPEAPPWPEAGP